MIGTLVLVLDCLIIPILCNDIISRDFRVFTKNICKIGCSRIQCHQNTLISIESVTRFQSSQLSNCSPGETHFQDQEYNCHFKFIENHVFKTCSNTYSCDICPDKIESKMYEPSTICTSEFDFKINYRCIPGVIKNDNICAHSYLDLSCYDRIDEKLVILNASIVNKIKVSSEDQMGCPQSNSIPSRSLPECQQLDKTSQAISKCSFRDKCSIGPNELTPGQCGNMHMRITHACVSSRALSSHYKKIKFSEPLITREPLEVKEESIPWFTKYKWKILALFSSVMVVIIVLTLLICLLVRRRRDTHRCNMNSQKDNLFNKLGQVKFSPPPSSIDKVNIDFDNETLGATDMYNCNSDNEDSNARSMYSSNLHSAMSYNSPFCIPPPTIDACQYFVPMLSPSHINMLDMPPIQLASSGNLTSSTSSSHGTPRGTKSSGIFSMNEASFEISHQV